MKLSKIFLALGLGVASATTLATPITTLEEANVLGNHISEVEKTFPEHLSKIQKDPDEFGVALLAAFQDNTVSSPKDLTLVKEQDLATFKKITDTVTNLIEERKKISGRAGSEPTSVIAKDMASAYNSSADILEAEMKKLKESLEHTGSTKTDEFIEFLRRKGKEFDEAATAFKTAPTIVSTQVRPSDTTAPKGAGVLADKYAGTFEVEDIPVAQLAPVFKPLVASINENTRNQNIAILKNRLDINRNAKDIELLRKEHRQAIAQVAAMASVDFGNVKARTIKVGAAVGHYKNQTALAVGAAIAPNNNWLINSKVSTSGKDFTFGLGATYEFSY